MRRAPTLQAHDLWFGYAEDAPALRGAELALQPGELLALIGPNGSGKTTLAKHLLGLLRPRRGRVTLDGADIAGRPVAELARTVGYVFQNPDHQLFGVTVESELSLGPRNLDLPEQEVQQRVERAAADFGLLDLRERRIGDLSYGQRKVLSLAAVAAMDPPILILDEPTTGLHWQAARQLMDWLVARKRAGQTALLITHDMRLVAEYADRAALMLAGRVAAVSAPYQMFGALDLLEQASLQPPQIVQLARRLAMPDEIVTVEGACAAVLGSRG